MTYDKYDLFQQMLQSAQTGVVDEYNYPIDDVSTVVHHLPVSIIHETPIHEHRVREPICKKHHSKKHIAANSNDNKRGTWFDENVSLAGNAGRNLIDHILYELYHTKGPGRRMNADRLRALIEQIIANALRCYFHRSPPLLAHYRRFPERTNGPNGWTGKQLNSATHQLGFVDKA